ncbi:hypothetical protein WA158_008546 [Blastocystis sp. Blastoise]
MRYLVLYVIVPLFFNLVNCQILACFYSEYTEECELCLPGINLFIHYNLIGTYGTYEQPISEWTSTKGCGGECDMGFICPAGLSKYTKNDFPCTDTDYYCPRGTSVKIPIPYATRISQKVYNETVTVSIGYEYCEGGGYCEKGIRHVCPPGRQRYDCCGGNLEACALCEPGLAASEIASLYCVEYCAEGYYCPRGSTSIHDKECGSVDVYCPKQSGYPIEVSSGCYTIPLTVKETIRSDQANCEEGYYCSGGRRFKCPEDRPYSPVKSTSIAFCTDSAPVETSYPCYGQYYSETGSSPCQLCFGIVSGDDSGNTNCQLCNEDERVYNNECVKIVTCTNIYEAKRPPPPEMLIGTTYQKPCDNDTHFGYTSYQCDLQVVDGVRTGHFNNKDPNPRGCQLKEAAAGHTEYFSRVLLHNIYVTAIDDSAKYTLLRAYLRTYQYILYEIEFMVFRNRTIDYNIYNVELNVRLGSNVLFQDDLIKNAAVKTEYLARQLKSLSPKIFHHYTDLTPLEDYVAYNGAYCLGDETWPASETGYIKYISCPYENLGGRIGKECSQNGIMGEWNQEIIYGCLPINPPNNHIYVDYTYNVKYMNHKSLSCLFMIDLERAVIRSIRVPLFTLKVHSPETIKVSNDEDDLQYSVRIEVLSTDKDTVITNINNSINNVIRAIELYKTLTINSEVSVYKNIITITSYN